MRHKTQLLSTTLSLLLLTGSAHSQQAYDRSRLTDLFQSDDYEGAVQWLGSFPALAGHPQYQSDLGYALYMQGSYETAKTAFFPVLERDSGNFKANLYLARANEELDIMDSALYYYQRLTRLAPKNYRYWQKVTQLYTDMAEYDSALLFIREGFLLNQNSGPLAVQFANSLVRTKRVEEADSVISAFLARDTTNQEVVIKKIDLAYRKGDYKQVIKWGEKLLRDSVEVTIPYINLAYSYLNSDSIDRSIGICEWLISKNKAISQVLYCAALGYSKKKEFIKSNEYLDKCISLSILKEAVSYFNAKSDNYEEMKQYRMAASYHDTSYYIFKTPLDLYYAGRIYDKYLNNPSKAASYYRQFVVKRKSPATPDEMRIFEYIDAYLESRNTKTGAKDTTRQNLKSKSKQ